MRIYYFAYSKNAPSGRYRGKYLLEEISATFGASYKVVSPTVQSLPMLCFLLLKNTIRIDTKNFYIVQKISTQGIYCSLISKIVSRSKKNCYDLDDAMYEFRDKHVVDFFISQCKNVVVASAHLLEYSKKLNPETHLITTPVPNPRFVKISRKKGPIVIGWIGIYSVHKESLNKLLFPVLKRLSFPVALQLLGVTKHEDMTDIINVFSEHKNITISIAKNIDWENEAAIQKRISQFDVGVMPLLDTEIGRSKSAFKLKQYLSCGVPSLASDTGDNKYFVQHGKNGYLCRTEAEWEKYISALHAMPDETFRSLCKEAYRSYATGTYTLRKTAKAYWDIIHREEKGYIR